MPNQNDPTEKAIKDHLEKVGDIVQSFTEEFYGFYDQELIEVTSDDQYDAALQRAKEKAEKKVEELEEKLSDAGKVLKDTLETAANQQDAEDLKAIEAEIENL